ncbi:MAG: NAD(P)H-hydrate dehydratase [Elusimicrobiota bacterium]|jgi:NAD(P)H-hydrate epimerase|nr:NAD(P)H-hydrate dehydratase [Elusimicrobiota bacterium]
MTNEAIKNFILKLKRKPESNKYSYGHILVIAGSKSMPGAGVLACIGALRAGAGIVSFAVNDSFLNQSCALSTPETIFCVYKSAADIIKYIEERKVTSAVIGPGLKTDINFIKTILSSINLPVILDASGLACFNGKTKILKSVKSNLIITPHLGEFSKLTSLTYEKIENNKEEIIKNFSKENSLICVLKGNKTTVSNGYKNYKNCSGTPAMATAGSGDVLSGLAAAFASRSDDTFAAVISSVFVHGLAGEICAKQKGENGITASDIAESIPYAIKNLGEKYDF